MSDQEFRVYSPIFLDAQWMHHKYLGWSRATPSPGITLFERKYGLITRRLVVIELEGVVEAERIFTPKAGFFAPLEVTLHFLRSPVGDPSAPSVFQNQVPLSASQRLLNSETIVIDLCKMEGELFSNFSSSYRRKVRKAEAIGLKVNVVGPQDKDVITHFYSQMKGLAENRELSILPFAAVSRMLKAQDALLYRCQTDRGEELAFLLVYIAGSSAIFIHSVITSYTHQQTSQFLHWAAMRDLKSRGIEWYDLGGVSEHKGISQFKQGFGGQQIDLGIELRRATLSFRAITWFRSLVRKTLGSSIA